VCRWSVGIFGHRRMFWFLDRKEETRSFRPFGEILRKGCEELPITASRTLDGFFYKRCACFFGVSFGKVAFGLELRRKCVNLRKPKNCEILSTNAKIAGLVL
jgi:hypothetical protein